MNRFKNAGARTVAAVACLVVVAIGIHRGYAFVTDRGPVLDVPGEVQGEAGRHIEILVTTRGGTVRWAFVDGPCKPDLLSLDRGKHVVVTGPLKGSYKFLCWTSVRGEPTDAKQVLVLAGVATNPVPPVPGPQPIVAGGKLYVTAVTDEHSQTVNVAAVIRGGLAARYCGDKQWVWHALDVGHPDLPAGVRKAAQDAGLPALVIQDDKGHVVPNGKAAKLPGTEAELLQLLKSIGG